VPVVNTTVVIERPPAAVFAYITTPAFWPQWQPAVLSLEGVVDRPLLLGEQVTAVFDVAGRTGVITWTVTRCRAPRFWTVEGLIAGQTNGGSVAYTLTRQGKGTQLARAFTFDTYQPIIRLQDALNLQRRVAAEAEAALAALKRVLEPMKG
jgi:hypothetical protein